MHTCNNADVPALVIIHVKFNHALIMHVCILGFEIHKEENDATNETRTLARMVAQTMGVTQRPLRHTSDRNVRHTYVDRKCRHTYVISGIETRCRTVPYKSRTIVHEK